MECSVCLMKLRCRLVFTLYDMEQAGVKVEGEELKRYGEELGARIVELEKEIYEMAGEEFNINSPKQLGVILFEKMEMPHGKEDKDRIFHSSGCVWRSLHRNIRS